MHSVCDRAAVGFAALFAVVPGCGLDLREGSGGSGTEGEPPTVVCPDEPIREYDRCSNDGQRCTYLEAESCSVTYRCEGASGCGDMSADTGCVEQARWIILEAQCDPAAVNCNSSVEGDVCAIPGDTCYPDCYDRVCGDDHRWGEFVDLECCFFTYRPECPATRPSNGSPCDQCRDHEPCDYREVRDCGEVTITASCPGSTWINYESACL
jgi:hypothetical protein